MTGLEFEQKYAGRRVRINGGQNFGLYGTVMTLSRRFELGWKIDLVAIKIHEGSILWPYHPYQLEVLNEQLPLPG